MTTAFNRFATQGNHFVTQLADELGMPENKTHTIRILRAVLHGIRSRITPASSMHLIYHLPMAVKAIYVDGWDIDNPQKPPFDYDVFLQEIYSTRGEYTAKIFTQKSEVEESIHAIFRILKRNLSDGEYTDMMSYMPIALRLNLIDYLMEGQSIFQ
jgi:uncharacterized protein (DUF2267 family)